VLVVEDNPDVRQVIAGSLQMLGYSVTQARDGGAGLAALEEGTPDLLIVDYAMPDMTGAEVLTQVQARWPELPVILATGYADMRTVEQLIGPDAILRKPFDINDLADAVQVALARRKSVSAG
jgi:CheY-like chemotaxis protein